MTFEEVKNMYKVILEGLEIDLSISSVDKIHNQLEEVIDIVTLETRIRLLNVLAQYASVAQGYAKQWEKAMKTPEAYGLAMGTEQINRAIRTEIESSRTILSNYREQLKIR